MTATFPPSAGQKAPSAKRCIKTLVPQQLATSTYACRQKAPSTKRCIKTCKSQVARQACCPGRVRKHRAPNGALRLLTRVRHFDVGSLVRKHRAPNGALRPQKQGQKYPRAHPVRKHRAPKGALRQGCLESVRNRTTPGQKAPSAKRCIKTALSGPRDSRSAHVRKRRAPKGALRPGLPEWSGAYSRAYVRKHRAPKGALRRERATPMRRSYSACQKAPSAKRCIKTAGHWQLTLPWCCQKAPSARRCIKTGAPASRQHQGNAGQKAPSTTKFRMQFP